MKIIIFGIGAMGSVYAGLFADAGHDVVGIDPWPIISRRLMTKACVLAVPAVIVC